MNDFRETETDQAFSDRFSAKLVGLKNVLETEYQALLDGDAKTVAALAAEKEQLSFALSDIRKELPETSKISGELKCLARQVEELAQLNHTLLKEVYQYYHGMLELFMRIGGQGQTYGKNGYVTVNGVPRRDTGIVA
jgi:flagellar biosynthesis/type III secretory pathway chaperone